MFSKILYLVPQKKILYKLSSIYKRYYEGFSYNMSVNGEERLLKLLSSENIHLIFDVGANIGNWTKKVYQFFENPSIHSFEISSSTFETLNQNLKNYKNVHLNNFGLSDENGEFSYKDYGANSGVNTINNSSEFHDHELDFTLKTCKLQTGDKYCSEKNVTKIDLLKIDVEGSENLVLQGFKKMLRNKSIRIIQFEYGFANGDSKYLMKDFYKFFDYYGYVIGPLKPNGVIFSEFKYELNNFNSGPNFIAVLKDETRLIEKIKGKPIRGYLS